MAVKGVDISVHNGNVDFQALKNAGIEFVIIRCGYGSDYTHQDDERFAENVRKADTAGMPWGVYLYSYATTTAMAKSEAQHTLRLLNGRKPAYGVWYDVEDKSQVNVDLVSICETYCNAIEAAGLYCGIYSMLSWFNGKLNSSRLDKYDKWVAQWSDSCEYKKPYGIWQFTDKLTIGGKVFDGNWAYKDYPSFTTQNETTTLSKSRVFSEQENGITNPYGNGHTGVDLGWDKDANTPIIAHSDGTVVFCQTGQPVSNMSATGNASYGNCVKIKHPNGYFTLYAHLSSVLVKNGQTVKKGQQIGNMGKTGRSDGEHLHFEVRNTYDVCIDPTLYIAADLPGLPTTEIKEEEDLTEEQIRKIVQEEIANYFAGLAKKEATDEDWYKPYVDRVKELGIMVGDPDGKFRPNALLTRAELAAVMVRHVDGKDNK